MTEFDYKIAGIPCIIEVTHYHAVKGSHSYNAASDWDYYGYVEIEYRVLDRKGKPAAWLERKVTDAIDTEIKADIAARMEASCEDY